MLYIHVHVHVVLTHEASAYTNRILTTVFLTTRLHKTKGHLHVYSIEMFLLEVHDTVDNIDTLCRWWFIYWVNNKVFL